MKVQTLSMIERQILVNQFRILAHLDPKSAEDYEANATILARGYTVQYDHVLRQIYEEMPVEDCTYVFDVLDMFDMLLHSYRTLKDKEGLVEEDVRFRGFDGNNETKRWAFAEHLKKEGRWEAVLSGGLDSHSMVTKSLYPQMLKRYEPIKQRILDSHSGNWLLTADQIKEVIGRKAD